jgi:hypothetical protein
MPCQFLCQSFKITTIFVFKSVKIMIEIHQSFLTHAQEADEALQQLHRLMEEEPETADEARACMRNLAELLRSQVLPAS